MNGFNITGENLVALFFAIFIFIKEIDIIQHGGDKILNDIDLNNDKLIKE